MNQRIVVMGLGRFGGGVGVSRFLASRGARVLVTDTAPAEQLRQSLAALTDLDIAYRLGEHRIEDFTGADLIVVNPAVDVRHNPYLQAAAAAGVPTTSEIRLLIAHLPDEVRRRRVIGITGSAGKSTVTAMIGHVLGKAWSGRRGASSEENAALAQRATRHARRVHIGGNLGGSLLGQLDQIGPDDWVVLELSSFMLEGLDCDRWSPRVAVLTNLAANHLDRHGTFEQYVRAKQTILEYQTPADTAILGRVDPHLLRTRTPHAIWLENLANYHPRPALSLAVPGEHNIVNATLAIEATVCAGVDRFVAADLLRDFPGLPHRLQFVAERDGVRYFNDSKATTPEAAILAIESFVPGTVHAILGGYDKGSDLSRLAQVAARHCRAIYTIGATGDALADLARAAPGEAEVTPSATLAAALTAAAARAAPAEAVLLSPGCASWDQFDNYEQRGQTFIDAVLRK